MRIFLFLTVLFIGIPSIGYTQTEENVQQEEEQLLQEEISDTLATGKEEKEDKKNSYKDILREMAKNRATYLQKELKLSNYVSRVVQKTIYEYSVKANDIIQSEMPESEKTKGLSLLIHFQNRKFKEIMDVEQFYQYINMKM